MADTSSSMVDVGPCVASPLEAVAGELAARGDEFQGFSSSQANGEVLASTSAAAPGAATMDWKTQRLVAAMCSGGAALRDLLAVASTGLHVIGGTASTSAAVTTAVGACSSSLAAWSLASSPDAHAAARAAALLAVHGSVNANDLIAAINDPRSVALSSDASAANKTADALLQVAKALLRLRQSIAPNSHLIAYLTRLSAPVTTTATPSSVSLPPGIQPLLEPQWGTVAASVAEIDGIIKRESDAASSMCLVVGSSSPSISQISGLIASEVSAARSALHAISCTSDLYAALGVGRPKRRAVTTAMAAPVSTAPGADAGSESERYDGGSVRAIEAALLSCGLNHKADGLSNALDGLGISSPRKQRSDSTAAGNQHQVSPAVVVPLPFDGAVLLRSGVIIRALRICAGRGWWATAALIFNASASACGFGDSSTASADSDSTARWFSTIQALLAAAEQQGADGELAPPAAAGCASFTQLVHHTHFLLCAATSCDELVAYGCELDRLLLQQALQHELESSEGALSSHDASLSSIGQMQGTTASLPAVCSASVIISSAEAALQQLGMKQPPIVLVSVSNRRLIDALALFVAPLREACGRQDWTAVEVLAARASTAVEPLPPRVITIIDGILLLARDASVSSRCIRALSSETSRVRLFAAAARHDDAQSSVGQLVAVDVASLSVAELEAVLLELLKATPSADAAHWLRLIQLAKEMRLAVLSCNWAAAKSRSHDIVACHSSIDVPPGLLVECGVVTAMSDVELAAAELIAAMDAAVASSEHGPPVGPVAMQRALHAADQLLHAAAAASPDEGVPDSYHSTLASVFASSTEFQRLVSSATSVLRISDAIGDGDVGTAATLIGPLRDSGTAGASTGTAAVPLHPALDRMLHVGELYVSNAIVQQRVAAAMVVVTGHSSLSAVDQHSDHSDEASDSSNLESLVKQLQRSISDGDACSCGTTLATTNMFAAAEVLVLMRKALAMQDWGRVHDAACSLIEKVHWFANSSAVSSDAGPIAAGSTAWCGTVLREAEAALSQAVDAIIVGTLQEALRATGSASATTSSPAVVPAAEGDGVQHQASYTTPVKAPRPPTPATLPPSSTRPEAHIAPDPITRALQRCEQCLAQTVDALTACAMPAVSLSEQAKGLMHGARLLHSLRITLAAGDRDGARKLLDRHDKDATAAAVLDPLVTEQLTAIRAMLTSKSLASELLSALLQHGPALASASASSTVSVSTTSIAAASVSLNQVLSALTVDIARVRCESLLALIVKAARIATAASRYSSVSGVSASSGSAWAALPQEVQVLLDTALRIAAMRQSALSGEWDALLRICEAIDHANFLPWPLPHDVFDDHGAAGAPLPLALPSPASFLRSPSCDAIVEVVKGMPHGAVVAIVRREVLMWIGEAREQRVAQALRHALVGCTAAMQASQRRDSVNGSGVATSDAAGSAAASVIAEPTAALTTAIHDAAVSAPHAADTAHLLDSSSRAHALLIESEGSSTGGCVFGNHSITLRPFMPQTFFDLLQQADGRPPASSADGGGTAVTAAWAQLHHLARPIFQLAAQQASEDAVIGAVHRVLSAEPRSSNRSAAEPTIVLATQQSLCDSCALVVRDVASLGMSTSQGVAALLELASATVHLRTAMAPLLTSDGDVDVGDDTIASAQSAVTAVRWQLLAAAASSVLDESVRQLLATEVDYCVSALRDLKAVMLLYEAVANEGARGQPGQTTWIASDGDSDLLQRAVTALLAVSPSPSNPQAAADTTSDDFRPACMSPLPQHLLTHASSLSTLRVAAVARDWSRVRELAASALTELSGDVAMYDDRQLAMDQSPVVASVTAESLDDIRAEVRQLHGEACHQLAARSLLTALAAAHPAGPGSGRGDTSTSSSSILDDAIGSAMDAGSDTLLVKHLLSCAVLLRRLRSCKAADDWSGVAGCLDVLATSPGLPEDVAAALPSMFDAVSAQRMAPATEPKHSFTGTLGNRPAYASITRLGIPSVVVELQDLHGIVALKQIEGAMMEAITGGAADTPAAGDFAADVTAHAPRPLPIDNGNVLESALAAAQAYLSSQPSAPTHASTTPPPPSALSPSLLLLMDTCKVLLELRRLLECDEADRAPNAEIALGLLRSVGMSTSGSATFSPHVESTAPAKQPLQTLFSPARPSKAAGAGAAGVNWVHDQQLEQRYMLEPGVFASRGLASLPGGFPPSSSSSDPAVSGPVVAVHALAAPWLNRLADLVHTRVSNAMLRAAFTSFTAGGVDDDDWTASATMGSVQLAAVSTAIRFASSRHQQAITRNRTPETQEFTALLSTARLLRRIRMCAMGEDWSGVLRRTRAHLVAATAHVANEGECDVDGGGASSSIIHRQRGASIDSIGSMASIEFQDDEGDDASVLQLLGKQLIEGLAAASDAEGSASAAPIHPAAVACIRALCELAHDNVARSVLSSALSNGGPNGRPGPTFVSETVSAVELRCTISAVEDAGGCFGAHAAALLSSAKLVSQVRQALVSASGSVPSSGEGIHSRDDDSDSLHALAALLEPLAGCLLGGASAAAGGTPSDDGAATTTAAVAPECLEELALVLGYVREMRVSTTLLAALSKLSTPHHLHNCQLQHSDDQAAATIETLEQALAVAARLGIHSDRCEQLHIVARGILASLRAVGVEPRRDHDADAHHTVAGVRQHFGAVSPALSSALAYFSSGPGATIFDCGSSSTDECIPRPVFDFVASIRSSHAASLHTHDLVSAIRSCASAIGESSAGGSDGHKDAVGRLLQCVSSARDWLAPSSPGSAGQTAVIQWLVHVAEAVFNTHTAVVNNRWDNNDGTAVDGHVGDVPTVQSSVEALQSALDAEPTAVDDEPATTIVREVVRPRLHHLRSELRDRWLQALLSSPIITGGPRGSVGHLDVTRGVDSGALQLAINEASRPVAHVDGSGSSMHSATTAALLAAAKRVLHLRAALVQGDWKLISTIAKADAGVIDAVPSIIPSQVASSIRAEMDLVAGEVRYRSCTSLLDIGLGACVVEEVVDFPLAGDEVRGDYSNMTSLARLAAVTAETCDVDLLADCIEEAEQMITAAAPSTTASPLMAAIGPRLRAAKLFHTIVSSVLAAGAAADDWVTRITGPAAALFGIPLLAPCATSESPSSDTTPDATSSSGWSSEASISSTALVHLLPPQSQATAAVLFTHVLLASAHSNLHRSILSGAGCITYEATLDDDAAFEHGLVVDQDRLSSGIAVVQSALNAAEVAAGQVSRLQQFSTAEGQIAASTEVASHVDADASTRSAPLRSMVLVALSLANLQRHFTVPSSVISTISIPRTDSSSTIDWSVVGAEVGVVAAALADLEASAVNSKGVQELLECIVPELAAVRRAIACTRVTRGPLAELLKQGESLKQEIVASTSTIVNVGRSGAEVGVSTDAGPRALETARDALNNVLARLEDGLEDAVSDPTSEGADSRQPSPAVANSRGRMLILSCEALASVIEAVLNGQWGTVLALCAEALAASHTDFDGADPSTAPTSRLDVHPTVASILRSIAAISREHIAVTTLTTALQSEGTDVLASSIALVGSMLNVDSSKQLYDAHEQKADAAALMLSFAQALLSIRQAAAAGDQPCLLNALTEARDTGLLDPSNNRHLPPSVTAEISGIQAQFASMAVQQALFTAIIESQAAAPSSSLSSSNQGIDRLSSAIAAAEEAEQRADATSPPFDTADVSISDRDSSDLLCIARGLLVLRSAASASTTVNQIARMEAALQSDEVAAMIPVLQRQLQHQQHTGHSDQRLATAASVAAAELAQLSHRVTLQRCREQLHAAITTGCIETVTVKIPNVDGDDSVPVAGVPSASSDAFDTATYLELIDRSSWRPGNTAAGSMFDIDAARYHHLAALDAALNNVMQLETAAGSGKYGGDDGDDDLATLRTIALSLRAFRCEVIEGRYGDAQSIGDGLRQTLTILHQHRLSLQQQRNGATESTSALPTRPASTSLSSCVDSEVESVMLALRGHAQREAALALLHGSLRLRIDVGRIQGSLQRVGTCGVMQDPMLRDSATAAIDEASAIIAAVVRVRERLQGAIASGQFQLLVDALSQVATRDGNAALYERLPEVQQVRIMIALAHQLWIDGETALQSFDAEAARQVLFAAEQGGLLLDGEPPSPAYASSARTTSVASSTTASLQHSANEVDGAKLLPNLRSRLQQLVSTDPSQLMPLALRAAVDRGDADGVARITLLLKGAALSEPGAVHSITSEACPLLRPYSSFERDCMLEATAYGPVSNGSSVMVVPSVPSTASNPLIQLLAGTEQAALLSNFAAPKRSAAQADGGRVIHWLQHAIQSPQQQQYQYPYHPLPAPLTSLPDHLFSAAPALSQSIGIICGETAADDADVGPDAQAGHRGSNSGGFGGASLAGITSISPVACRYTASLIAACLPHPPLRDELFVQMMRNLNVADGGIGDDGGCQQNECTASPAHVTLVLRRCLQLLYLCLCSFPPHQSLENRLEWFIRSYIDSVALVRAGLRPAAAVPMHHDGRSPPPSHHRHEHPVTSRLLHALHRTAFTGPVPSPPSAGEAGRVMEGLFDAY